MKKIFLALMLLGEILMAATIKHFETDGVQVPVILEQDKRLPLVTMQLVFTNSGSIADTKAGLAKLGAKMMGEGTKKLGSSAFAEALEAKAIHISASVGKETFVIEMSCLKEELENALGFLEMLLADPNLSEDVLKKVKKTTIGSLSRKENDYDYVASNALKALLFAGTPLQNPASGTIESVESITLADIKSFLETHLVRSRLIVALGGDVELEAIEKRLRTVVHTLEKGEKSEVANFKANAHAKENILKRETEQAYIYFGAPFAMQDDSKEQYKAKVAAFILGAGGFGSRMMEEIRVKRGLAYSAYARIDISKSSSYFNGYLQTKIESLEEAQTTVKAVIAEFVTNGVTQEELDQTKKFLLGSEPLRVETMSQRLNRAFMEFYKGQEAGFALKELELIQALPLEELNSFIKTHTEINDLSFAIVTK
ncbi:MAG: pitrilysin family protein [Thiovulaceae bacterium]|nr:pitrilysin family protein [Sulfurimonadaceae bacterium]